MSENINLTADETTVENAPERFTLDYCLEQLEKLAVQTEYLNQAISEILESESVPISAAMVDIVKFRETTNQRLISFYEKMYEDLKPQKAEKYAPEPNLILGDMMQLIKDPDSTAEQMSFASSIIEKYLDKKF